MNTRKTLILFALLVSVAALLVHLYLWLGMHRQPDWFEMGVLGVFIALLALWFASKPKAEGDR